MITTLPRIAIGSLLALMLLAGLQACNDTVVQNFPEGSQTMSGVLVSAPISIVRRGTHVLSLDNKPKYYVESSTVDLRDFEGVDVVISGIIEPNTDQNDMPVLVASGVTLVDIPSRSWDVPQLRLSLETPDIWSGQSFDDGMQFAQTGTSIVLLRIFPSTLTQLPSGSMLQVAGRRAVRVTATGGQLVYVQNGQDILAFRFTPNNSIALQQADKAFTRILRSVKFGKSVSSGGSINSSTTGSTASGAVLGQPCGGAAGILCPQGQYCEIADSVTNIGRCRSLQR